MDIVGIRPGEKIHEELFYEEENVEPTSVPKVLKAVSEKPPVTVREDAQRLLAMATGGREEHLRAALLNYARWAGSAQTEMPHPAESPAPLAALAADVDRAHASPIAQ
jgi:FlaA1/EpsC-like NDP-sugar epimerase